MTLKRDDYVKIMGTNGEYNYGYIEKVQDRGYILIISLYEEGQSKICFDAESRQLDGQYPVDYLGILSEIEKKVLTLISEGCTAQEISDKLDLKPSTVRVYFRNLRIKLRLETRSQLVALAQGLKPMIEQNGTSCKD
jgi:DNA-binding CsgD family transcriptional regulator